MRRYKYRMLLQVTPIGMSIMANTHVVNQFWRNAANFEHRNQNNSSCLCVPLQTCKYVCDIKCRHVFISFLNNPLWFHFVFWFHDMLYVIFKCFFWFRFMCDVFLMIFFSWSLCFLTIFWMMFVIFYICVGMCCGVFWYLFCFF